MIQSLSVMIAIAVLQVGDVPSAGTRSNGLEISSHVVKADQGRITAAFLLKNVSKKEVWLDPYGLSILGSRLFLYDQNGQRLETVEESVVGEPPEISGLVDRFVRLPSGYYFGFERTATPELDEGERIGSFQLLISYDLDIAIEGVEIWKGRMSTPRLLLSGSS